LSWEELEAIEAAFHKRRELEQQERDVFLDWVRQAAEAKEKLELTERMHELELENRSLREVSEEEDAEPVTREEFERDLAHSNEAEVLSDMLTDEDNDDVIEETDVAEPPDEEETESDAESEELD
jgi:hypothetical protein